MLSAEIDKRSKVLTRAAVLSNPFRTEEATRNPSSPRRGKMFYNSLIGGGERDVPAGQNLILDQWPSLHYMI
jgi:hypothetical protein